MRWLALLRLLEAFRLMRRYSRARSAFSLLLQPPYYRPRLNAAAPRQPLSKAQDITSRWPVYLYFSFQGFDISYFLSEAET